MSMSAATEHLTQHIIYQSSCSKKGTNLAIEEKIILIAGK